MYPSEIQSHLSLLERLWIFFFFFSLSSSSYMWQFHEDCMFLCLCLCLRSRRGCLGCRRGSGRLGSGGSSSAGSGSPVSVSVFSRGKGTGWPWWGSAGIQCRQWRRARRWCRPGGQTGPGTGCGARWARAARGGPCWLGPGGRCLVGSFRAGQRGAPSPVTPPGGPRCRWSPEQQGLCRCRDGAGWAGVWRPGAGGHCPCERGYCDGRSTGPEWRWWVWCRPAGADDLHFARLPCAAGPGEDDRRAECQFYWSWTVFQAIPLKHA